LRIVFVSGVGISGRKAPPTSAFAD